MRGASNNPQAARASGRTRPSRFTSPFRSTSFRNVGIPSSRLFALQQRLENDGLIVFFLPPPKQQRSFPATRLLSQQCERFAQLLQLLGIPPLELRPFLRVMPKPL